MKNRILITLSAFIVLISACQKGSYPYISKDEATSVVKSQNPSVLNVAFTYNNDIYYAADIDKTPVRITTSGGTKKFIKMSHDHTKFAYQDAANYIEIVDNTGKLITTLTQYTQVKAFDWSADDKTLYILNNGLMVYYGPAMALPAITYPGVIAGYSTEIVSASVSMTGDFAYIIHYWAYSYGDKYRLVIKPAGKTNVITYDNNSITYTMNYVNFSANKQDMVLGYRDATFIFNSFERVEFFTALNAYPDFSYESSESYGTPVYNSTINFFVCGFTPNNTNKVVLSAISTVNSDKTKISSIYSSNGNGVYTDWK